MNTERFRDHISSLVTRKQEVSFFFNKAYLLVLKEDFRYVLKYIPDIVRH
jgi:hypothetical protein